MPPKFLGVCLCFTSFLAFHGNAIAATDHPRSLLKGIAIIKYYDYVESTVGGERCKINYQNLTTSLQFVANQSAKLKIITEREHATRRDELYSQVRSLPATNTDKILAANKSADDYNFMPTLVIHVSPLELSSGCAGVINATLSAHVDAGARAVDRTAAATHLLPQGAARHSAQGRRPGRALAPDAVARRVRRGAADDQRPALLEDDRVGGAAPAFVQRGTASRRNK